MVAYYEIPESHYSERSLSSDQQLVMVWNDENTYTDGWPVAPSTQTQGSSEPWGVGAPAQ